eukprot:UN23971
MKQVVSGRGVLSSKGTDMNLILSFSSLHKLNSYFFYRFQACKNLNPCFLSLLGFQKQIHIF